MTDRPSLHGAIAAAMTAGEPGDPAGAFRPAYNEIAANRDAALDHANTDPAWYAALPAYDRGHIDRWRGYRANNPKEEAA